MKKSLVETFGMCWIMVGSTLLLQAASPVSTASLMIAGGVLVSLGSILFGISMVKNPRPTHNPEN